MRADAARALLARVPDEPRWTETRAMLLDGRAVVLGGSDGAVVHAAEEDLAAAVGRPPPELLRAFADAAPASTELLVQADDAARVAGVLAAWTLHPCRLHVRPVDAAPPAPEHPVVVVEPGGAAELADALEEVGAELRRLFERVARRAPVAVALDVSAASPGVRRAAAFCLAGAVTEGWCDLSVETVPTLRRRGFARSACAALLWRLAADGRRPVWGAADANHASRALAASLGFVPAARVAVLTPPGHGGDV